MLATRRPLSRPGLLFSYCCFDALYSFLPRSSHSSFSFQSHQQPRLVGTQQRMSPFPAPPLLISPRGAGPAFLLLSSAPPSPARREVTPTCGCSHFVSLAIVASGVRIQKVGGRCPRGFPLTSRKMTRSCEPRRAPPRPPESPLSSWCFVGITLVTLVLQLPTAFGRNPERVCAPETNWRRLGSGLPGAEGGGGDGAGTGAGDGQEEMVSAGPAPVGGAGPGPARGGVGAEGSATEPRGCAVAGPGRVGSCRGSGEVCLVVGTELPRMLGRFGVWPGRRDISGRSVQVFVGCVTGWGVLTWAEGEGLLSSALCVGMLLGPELCP